MVVLAVAGVYALFRGLDERSAPAIVIEDASLTEPIVVDLRGAVKHPAVYQLPPGSRLQDAIAAGGGLAPSADLSTINLARRLRDGEVVVVAALPTSGGSPVPSVTMAGTSGEAASHREKLNINTATAAELENLPGIGEVIAARIVAFREANGPYRSVDDLVNVEGISTRTIEQFRDMVTTNP